MSTQAPETPTTTVRLGLRENLAQFALLVGVNALVGGMIGQERTVLPLLATEEFHLTAFTSTLTFIAAFGIVKAVTNFFAGTLGDRYGRKPVLIAGWIVAIPIPLLLMWAPSWGWVVFANVLLGVNQGLTWSTTVIMKIDLDVGRRGDADRCRHRNGLPHPARSDRRCRPPHLACPLYWHLPAMARRRVRPRRAPRRRPRRPRLDTGRHLRRCCAHRAVRAGRRRAHVRDEILAAAPRPAVDGRRCVERCRCVVRRSGTSSSPSCSAPEGRGRNDSG